MYPDELKFDDTCLENGIKQFRNGHTDRVVLFEEGKYTYIARVEIKSPEGKLSKSQKRMEEISSHIYDIPYIVMKPEEFTNIIEILKRDGKQVELKNSLKHIKFDEPTLYDRCTVLLKQMKKLLRVYEKSVR